MIYNAIDNQFRYEAYTFADLRKWSAEFAEKNDISYHDVYRHARIWAFSMRQIVPTFQVYWFGETPVLVTTIDNLIKWLNILDIENCNPIDIWNAPEGSQWELDGVFVRKCKPATSIFIIEYPKYTRAFIWDKKMPFNSPEIVSWRQGENVHPRVMGLLRHLDYNNPSQFFVQRFDRFYRLLKTAQMNKIN